MTITDIELLKWRHEFNLDQEESPCLFFKHGASLGFEIDNQTEDDTLFLLYHFPDNYTLIDKFYKCGGGCIYEGYVDSIEHLQEVMISLNIHRII